MDKWDQRRKQPYTEIGIRRCKCIRCGKPARFQWQICSDGNYWRPICAACDVALNRLVLEFMRHPRGQLLMCRYEEERL